MKVGGWGPNQKEGIIKGLEKKLQYGLLQVSLLGIFLVIVMTVMRVNLGLIMDDKESKGR
jgi:hypothetical protein